MAGDQQERELRLGTRGLTVRERILLATLAILVFIAFAVIYNIE